MKYLAPIVMFLRSLTRPAPARDWLIAVLLALLTGLGMIAVAIYFYFGLETGAIIVPKAPERVSPPAVSREALKQVLDAYHIRALNYQSGNVGN